MAYEFLKVTREGAIAHVELNRPPVNALNSGLVEEISKVALELHSDESVKVALLSGAGKHFAAGADIKEIAGLEPGDAVDDFATAGHESFLNVERGRVIWIAVIRGFCLGGGCELAMACHMRIADRSAIFGQPEIKLGICPGFGATQRLPRLIGIPRAMHMLLTGDQIDALQAERWGLATLLAPEGKDVAEFGLETARKIASYGRLVIEANRELLTYNLEFDAERGMDRESELFGELSKSEDMREGFSAFIGKREPVFKDK